MSKQYISETKPHRTNNTALISAVLFVAVALIGCDQAATCGDKPPASSGDVAAECSPSDALEQQQPSTLNAYINRDPGGFDVVKVASSSKAYLEAQAPIYELLFEYDSIEDELRPVLAVSAESLNNDTVWRVTLREGVQFSNGAPLTSADYVAHFDRVLNSESASVIQGSLSTDIVSVKAVDDLTFDFVLAEPNPVFDLNMGSAAIAWFGMNPSKYTLENESASNFNARPVGTGPYMLESWVPGDSITYIRNPYYWDKSAQHFDRLVLKIVPVGTAAIRALESGELDAIFAVEGLTIATARKNPDLNVVKGIAGFEGYLFHMNVGREPFNDVRVRQALAHGINREAALATLLRNEGELSSQTFLEGQKWYCNEIKYPEYNPDKARALLAEYGKPVSFNISVMSIPFFVSMAEFYQAMWKDIGVDVAVNVISRGPGFSREVRGGKLDMWYSAGRRSIDPFLSTFDLHSESPNNIFGLNSQSIDQSIEAIQSSKSFEQRYAANCRYQAALIEEMPFLRFIRTENAVITRKDLHGARPPSATFVGYEKLRPNVDSVK